MALRKLTRQPCHVGVTAAYGRGERYGKGNRTLDAAPGTDTSPSSQAPPPPRPSAPMRPALALPGQPHCSPVPRHRPSLAV
jgi:hypothetical protein